RHRPRRALAHQPPAEPGGALPPPLRQRDRRPRPMSTLTGTGTLLRFQLRRDRFWLSMWIVGIVALVVSSVAGVEGLYPTEELLAEAAVLVENNAVAIALNGPAVALDT